MLVDVESETALISIHRRPWEKAWLIMATTTLQGSRFSYPLKTDLLTENLTRENPRLLDKKTKQRI